MSPSQVFGALRFGLRFGLLQAGSVLFLWHTDTLGGVTALVWLAALSCGLWCLGAVLQGRLSISEVLLIEAAALSTALAAAGLVELHRVCKPLAMAIAMYVVARSASWKSSAPLLVALSASLAGDVFLMLPGHFIAGLASFLCAPLAYLAQFKRGQAWFPRRQTLLATFSCGAAMYLVLWIGGLPTAPRGPAAAYVLVIALMAAQVLIVRGMSSALNPR